MKETDYTRSIFHVLVFLSFIIAAIIFKFMASVIIPVIVAMLLAFVFYPFIKKLNRFKIPWIVGILITVVIFIAAFYIIGNLLFISMKTILSAYPRYESKLTTIYEIFAKTFKLNFNENASLLSNLWNSLGIRTAIQNAALSLSNILISGIKTILIISLLVVFLLIELKNMKQKIQIAFPKEDTNSKLIFIATKTISEVTHYLSINFFVSLVTGTLVGLSTAVIKMDFPVLWGFLSFVLNFIPNFGSIISWAITTLFAVLQFYPSWGCIIYVGIMILLINFIIGNIIEPRWEGTDLGLSPFVILVSLAVWGYIWGFIGMILAVPIMVIIKIICENIEFLKPFAILMGNDKKRKNDNNLLKQ